MTTASWFTKQHTLRSRNGFTLIELLASLMVISIAGTIFISMFISSMRLGNASRDHRVGLQLAQEYLTELQERPDQFEWPNYDGKVDTLLPVDVKANDDDVQKATQPSAMPTTKRSHVKTDILYSDFSWKAYARLPDKDSNVVEISVEVTWSDDTGHDRSFTLSSLASRESREGMD